MEKIGTGEGAQAYGHGLYFAENPKVAGEYHSALAPSEMRVGGRPYDSSNPDHLASQWRGIFLKRGVTPQEIHDNMMKQAQEWSAEAKRMRDPLLARERQAQADLYRAASKRVFANDLPPVERHRTGATYKVDIKASPEEFLDWDKPLSQQSPKVREALRREMHNPDYADSDRLTGEHVYEYFMRKSGHRDAMTARSEAAQFLRDAGIKGIRYLDQGSRSGGAGTSNYVVFDESLIDILEKGGAGAATLAALLGLSGAGLAAATRKKP